VKREYLCTIVQERGSSIQLRRENGEHRILIKEASHANDRSPPEFAEIGLPPDELRILRDALNEALGEGSKT
jgi:hypothetical protein